MAASKILPLGVVCALALLACATERAKVTPDPGFPKPESFAWLNVTPYPGWNGPSALAMGPQAETFRAVRSQAEWSAVWRTLRITSVEPRPSAPDVEFAKFTMLVAALGTRPTGGYTVHIEYALDDGTAVHVSVLEIRPGNNCTVTTALIYPITIAIIPRNDLPVQFEVEAADLDCSTGRYIRSKESSNNLSTEFPVKPRDGVDRRI
jgi:hypothetical protein